MNTGISKQLAILLCFFLALLNSGCKKRDSAQPAPQLTSNKSRDDARSAPQTTSSKKSSAVDLVKALKAQDLQFHPIGLWDFITDNQTKKGDQILAGEYSVKELSVYRVPQRRKGEIWIKCILPFRVHKAESAMQVESRYGLKGAGTLTACRANFVDSYFLTKNDQLSKCNPQEIPGILARDGIVFYGEHPRGSDLYFGAVDVGRFSGLFEGLPTSPLDRLNQKKSELAVDIEIEKLQYGSALVFQDSWGMYQRDALLRSGYDSDKLCVWNMTGAFTGMTPEYFRPTIQKKPKVVSAMLISATLRTKAGEIIASFDAEDAEADRRQPDQSASGAFDNTPVAISPRKKLVTEVDAFKQLLFQESNSNDEILSMLGLQAARKFSSAEKLLLNLLAEVAIERVIERVQDETRGCFEAIVASKPGTPYREAINDVPGQQNFVEFVESSKFIATFVRSLETVRDNAPKSNNKQTSAEALERAQHATTFRYMVWGAEAPYPLHEVYMHGVGANYPEVASLIKGEKSLSSYQIESHLRLIQKLADKVKIGRNDLKKVVQKLLDDESNVNDALWEMEKVLAAKAASNDR